MIPVPVAAIHHFGAVANMMALLAAIMPIAQYFARRLTAPLACHSRIIGPNVRCASRRSCSRLEPRAAAKAAKNFAEADRIRQALLAQGIVLKDSAAGTTWEAAQ